MVAADERVVPATGTMARRDPDASPAEGERRAQRAHHVLPSARPATVLGIRGDCPGEKSIRMERGESRLSSFRFIEDLAELFAIPLPLSGGVADPETHS